MRGDDFEFKIGRFAGWFSTRPETLCLGISLVHRFGQTEFHLGLILAEFCIFTTKSR